MAIIRNVYLCIIIGALSLCVPMNGYSTMLYTTVGGGISHRATSGGDMPFSNGILSPIIEAGARTARDESAGFYVRFLLDPENTSHVSSYYLTGKWNYFYVADILYLGISGGMHIESSFTEESDNNSTVTSEEARVLFTCALHSGVSLEIMAHHFLVFEGFASYSIGGIRQWSVNGTVGIMSMF